MITNGALEWLESFMNGFYMFFFILFICKLNILKYRFCLFGIFCLKQSDSTNDGFYDCQEESEISDFRFGN